MASITREIDVPLAPHDAWQIVRDVGQAHVRLFPRMLAGLEMQDGGAARTVTFANGLVLRELIVAIDDARMRVAYSSVGRATHHNSSLQVLPADGGRCRIAWITDVLPHELAPMIASLMDGGVADMRQALAAGA